MGVLGIEQGNEYRGLTQAYDIGLGTRLELYTSTIAKEEKMRLLMVSSGIVSNLAKKVSLTGVQGVQGS